MLPAARNATCATTDPGVRNLVHAAGRPERHLRDNEIAAGSMNLVPYGRCDKPPGIGTFKFRPLGWPIWCFEPMSSSKQPRTPEQIATLQERVAKIESWYHRIDLGDGVETPGHFRMADYLDHYNFPADLSGKRVLDVGASTGFFAYEFERRGADEVVGIELPSWEAHDWTPRKRRELASKDQDRAAKDNADVMIDGFTVVGEALGSTRTRRVFKPIYELTAAELGTFDIVFSGAMLMHVRDPILGIQRMRECCKPDGRLIVSISALQTEEQGPIARFVGEWNECNWWQMSPAGLDSILECCDFDRIENRAHYTLEDVTGQFKDPTYVCHALPRQD